MPCCGQQAMGLFNQLFLCQFTLFFSCNFLFVPLGSSNSLSKLYWSRPIYLAHAFASLIDDQKKKILYMKCFLFQFLCAGAGGFNVFFFGYFSMDLILLFKCTCDSVVDMKGCVDVLLLRFSWLYCFVSNALTHTSCSKTNAGTFDYTIWIMARHDF